MRYKDFLTESIAVASLEDVLYMLYYNCKPFLKELLRGGNINPMWSGRSGNKGLFIKKIRKQRAPKDMPYATHEALDEEFQTKFGVYARSESIFCTGRYNDAKDYGDNTYMIFPTGTKYKFIWSTEIRDLFTDWYDDPKINWYDDPEENMNYLRSDDENEVHEIAYNMSDQAYEDLSDDVLQELEDTNIDRYRWVTTHIDDYMNDARDEYLDTIKDRNNDILDDLMKSYTDKNLNKAIESGNEIMVLTKEVLGIHELYETGVKHYFRVNGTKEPTSTILQETFKNKSYTGIRIWNK